MTKQLLSCRLRNVALRALESATDYSQHECYSTGDFVLDRVGSCLGSIHHFVRSFCPICFYLFLSVLSDLDEFN